MTTIAARIRELRRLIARAEKNGDLPLVAELRRQLSELQPPRG